MVVVKNKSAVVALVENAKMIVERYSSRKFDYDRFAREMEIQKSQNERHTRNDAALAASLVKVCDALGSETAQLRFRMEALEAYVFKGAVPQQLVDGVLREYIDAGIEIPLHNNYIIQPPYQHAQPVLQMENVIPPRPPTENIED